MFSCIFSRLISVVGCSAIDWREIVVCVLEQRSQSSCCVGGWLQVCWISSTYYLPDEKAIPGQPGIIKRHISYYQWVPVVLLAQALFFRMPCMFWRVFSDRSGININNLVEAAETIQNALYPERREKTIRYMIRHLDHYLDYQHDYRGGGTISPSRV